MLLMLIGYLGAMGIVGFSLRSAHAAVRKDAARKLDPHSFVILAAASLLLCAYAVSLADPVFALANGASGVLNAIVATTAFRARRQIELVV